MEKWYEMTARHKRERIEMVQSLARSGYTQTQAAKILDTSVTGLNNFIQREGIHWPVKKQGRAKHETINPSPRS